MATLTTRQRKNLASSKKKRNRNFVFPSRAPGSGSYPINDLAHGRAALSMGAQHASPSQLRTIKKEVYAKYPSLRPKRRKA